MKDILNFDKMIAPTIIKYVYWVALVGIIIMGGNLLFGSGAFAFPFHISLLYILGATFTVRLYCELVIVAFKIHEALQEIKNKQ